MSSFRFFILQLDCYPALILCKIVGKLKFTWKQFHAVSAMVGQLCSSLCLHHNLITRTIVMLLKYHNIKL